MVRTGGFGHSGSGGDAGDHIVYDGVQYPLQTPLGVCRVSGPHALRDRVWTHLTPLERWSKGVEIETCPFSKGENGRFLAQIPEIPISGHFGTPKNTPFWGCFGPPFWALLDPKHTIHYMSISLGLNALWDMHCVHVV